MSASVDIDVASPLWEPQERWHAALGAAADACRAHAGAAWPGRAISFLLCDDAAIRALNGQWRGIDKATNVLSFPVGGPQHPYLPLGDVAIAFETAGREALAEGKDLSDHVTHLAVHGVLHLLGHDHLVAAEADAMEDAERRILSSLGIADPYAGSEPVREGAEAVSRIP